MLNEDFFKDFHPREQFILTQAYTLLKALTRDETWTEESMKLIRRSALQLYPERT